MRIEIRFDQEINPCLYAEYSRFIFSKVKRLVHRLVLKNLKRYKVREDAILNCSLIVWKRNPPKRIDLAYYVEHCLELVKIKGVYVIRLNERRRLPRSFTKVSTLIRILEFGTDKIPELPLIRRVLLYYQFNYQKLFTEFMKERFMR